MYTGRSVICSRKWCQYIKHSITNKSSLPGFNLSTDLGHMAVGQMERFLNSQTHQIRQINRCNFITGLSYNSN